MEPSADSYVITKPKLKKCIFLIFLTLGFWGVMGLGILGLIKLFKYIVTKN